MQAYLRVAVAFLAGLHGVAVLGEVPTTPGPDIAQLTGGNGSIADVRPGMRLAKHMRLRFEAAAVRSSLSRSGDLTGARYRKQLTLSMVDVYPIAGFHISGGFRSWKGKMASGAAGTVGRLNMNGLAPLLPIRSTHANMSPMATVGYRSQIAPNTILGFEAGVISERGKNKIVALPGEASQRWSNTGAIAQASLKMRFF